MKIKNPKLLISLIAINQIAGFVGSIFTTNSIPTWYASLNKPPFNPPNWIFGPVWITLYTLMGISIYLIFTSKSKQKKSLIVLYFVHLAVNTTWSVVFFGLQDVLLALITISLLWGMIAILVFKFYKINENAAYLLIPYLTWVSFATILNYNIWLLN